MKIFSVTLLLGLAAPFAKAQSPALPDYIYMEGKDTIWCTITTIRRSQNNIYTIKYKDQSGKEIQMGKDGVSGVKECRQVKSFRANGIQSDLLPEDPPKDKELIHKEVKVKGRITVYAETWMEVFTTMDGKRGTKMYAQLDKAEKSVLFPDGTYLELDAAKKKLKDMLKQCSIKVPDDKADDKHWEEAIVQYNDSCK